MYFKYLDKKSENHVGEIKHNNQKFKINKIYNSNLKSIFKINQIFKININIHHKFKLKPLFNFRYLNLNQIR